MPTAIEKLKRALWLAFQASSPLGMGFLHTKTASEATEESLYNDCVYRDPTSIDTDYVFGRMMKTSFSVSPDGVLDISPKVPRHDYQSWAGTYATAADLIKATEESFSKQPA